MSTEIYYPPVGFSFKVNVEGITGINEGSFQEVSGLNAKITPESIKEGGENRFEHRFPNRPVYENLILKRGMLLGSPLITWARNSFDLFEFKPKLVNLNLLDEKGAPISTWRFINAYPVALKVSDLKAQENAIVVETLELCYDYFTKVN
ncbi:MAG: phage tail protein [Daejeonella sp.]|uniref:phage tail protein n=1 Tax=Daejeonella sp. JGW-45 TaxID=3034148 RepID=UPI0023EC579E|nr:phage tail protein [Daejeonella sp. JGW-45]